MGVPTEVRDDSDLDDESREHGQWPANGRYPPDKVTTRELQCRVLYEAAMVGRKVRHHPNPIRLCKHSHAESVAESVGTVVDDSEKKNEGHDVTGRGFRNVAIELWVRATLHTCSWYRSQKQSC